MPRIPNEIGKPYIDKARELLKQENLGSDPKLVFDRAEQRYYFFDLAINSYGFSKLFQEKIATNLWTLYYLDMPMDYYWITPLVHSDRNDYSYKNDSLYKNGTNWYADSPSTTDSSFSSASTSSSRFSGGNLHQATVAEWRKANYSNRLATSADFIAATQNVDYGNLAEFKQWATDLETCISTAVSSGDVDNEQVTFISSICTVQLFP